MRGIQLVGHGGLDKLILRGDLPVPVPGPNDVLIKVGAAGINNTDINTRIGWYSKSDRDSSDASWSGSALQFPLIQGADVCGTVVSIGDKVNPSKLGKRVLVEPCITEASGKTLEQPWYFGSECDGGFAEYTVVAARHAHEITSSLSDVELASFPCSYSTAENLLTRSQVCNNDVVLVTGASGGVGSAVIQLAKARGAQVVAITSPSKVNKLNTLGADRTLAREDDLLKKLGRNTVDVVIDLVAGSQWPVLLEVLKPFGRYAVAGAIGGPFVEMDVRTLYLKDLSLFGCTVLGETVFRNLICRIESGDVRPVVSKSFSLAQIPEAQRQFESKTHIGKFVVDLQLSDTLDRE
jgi:NADPH:quinone reductase-like Zn-dependent oxidoreductase